MHEKYLGDSFDFIKRFLCSTLSPIATLYAHEQFVPSGIREKYTKMTTIPILGNERPGGRFGVLLDPDTGITQHGATRRHASLPWIVEVNRELRPHYLICYDQSYHRKYELDRKGQRATKMKFLLEHSLPSFYYVSHAPFLFTAQDENILGSLFSRLVSEGIPKERFEPSGSFGESTGRS